MIEKDIIEVCTRLNEGTSGAVVSIVIDKAEEEADVLPAASVAVAVSE